MLKHTLSAVSWLLLSAVAGAATAQATKTDTIHTQFGVEVSDPYRWMENGDEFKLNTWIADQRKKTELYLGDALQQELVKVESAELFESAEKENKLYRQLKLEYEQQITQQQDRIPFVSAPVTSFNSPNNQYQVILTNNNRGDLQTLRIINPATGEYLPDVLPVKFASFTFTDNEEYLLYSTDRDHRNGGGGWVVKAHRIGDANNLFDKTIWQAETPFQSAAIENVNGQDFFTISDAGTNTLSFFQFDRNSQTIGQKLWQHQGDISWVASDDRYSYFKSYENSPLGEIVRLDLSTFKLSGFIPAGNKPLDKVAFRRGHVFVFYFNEDVTHEVKRFIPEKNEFVSVEMPFSGTFGLHSDNFEVLYAWGGGAAIPWMTMTFNEETLNFELSESSKILLANPEEEAEAIQYRIKGQTSVVWVVKNKGVKLTKQSPLYLYGYGGFRISLAAHNGYAKSYKALLNAGGAVAIATLPGGLEKGADWHRLGNLKNKKNVFRAFAKVAKTLHRQGISSPEHTAIGGVSNGGLLVAATINMFPELFKAAIPEVGVLDTLRFHKFTAGKWWIREYGNPDSRKYFRYLRSYSPYHNIDDDKEYPSILVMTGDGDDRVVPAHSYKYVARLQDELDIEDDDDDNSVVLLYTQKFAGHGGSADPAEIQKAQAVKMAFLLKELL